MTAAEKIAQIDKLIDANRAAVLLRIRCRPETSADWQRVRDAHPDFHARDCELYRQRGLAQVERDEAAEKAWKREQAKKRRDEVKRAKAQTDATVRRFATLPSLRDALKQAECFVAYVERTDSSQTNRVNARKLLNEISAALAA